MIQDRFVGIVVGMTTVAITLLVLGQFEREAEGNIPFDCMDPTERERVRDIALHGIDKGLEEATQHLYSVWQKDPNTEQPKRARVGIVNAINAHARARKFALDWIPPTCPPTEK
jgi:hypothetical protein